MLPLGSYGASEVHAGVCEVTIHGRDVNWVTPPSVTNTNKKQSVNKTVYTRQTSVQTGQLFNETISLTGCFTGLPSRYSHIPGTEKKEEPFVTDKTQIETKINILTEQTEIPDQFTTSTHFGSPLLLGNSK